MMHLLRDLLMVIRGDGVVVSKTYLAALESRVSQADKRAEAQRKSRAERAKPEQQ